MKRAMVAALAVTVLMPAAVAAQDPTADPTAIATPDVAATTTPEVEVPRIFWSSGGIELVADDLRLRVTDEVVTAPGEVLPLGTTYDDHGQLEAWWYEQGSQQRLNFNLDLDESHWWVDSIWAYDQHGRNSEWIYFKGLEHRTRTALGEPLTGDFRFRSNESGPQGVSAEGIGGAAPRRPALERLHAGHPPRTVDRLRLRRR